MRANALTTLKKLLSCRLQQVLLYRDLVTLRDDLPLIVVNNDDRDDDRDVSNDKNDRNDGNDRNEHSEHFRYEGERAGAEAHLQGTTHLLEALCCYVRLICKALANLYCTETRDSIT